MRTSWWTQRGAPQWFLSNNRASNVATVAPFTDGFGCVHPVSGGLGRRWSRHHRPLQPARPYVLASHRPPVRYHHHQGPTGLVGAIPFIGNWDGLGSDEIGAYEPTTRTFWFAITSGAMARRPQVFGNRGDLPIIGDWDGDGTDGTAPIDRERRRSTGSKMTGRYSQIPSERRRMLHSLVTGTGTGEMTSVCIAR